ncbi:unnamed protein product [Alternaria alternata]
MALPTRPDDVLLDGQQHQIHGVIVPTLLKKSYLDLNEAASHVRTLLDNMAFRRPPTFRWISVRDTQLPVSKMKRQACRRAAISLWKDRQLHIVKPPTSVHRDDDTPEETAAKPLQQDQSTNGAKSRPVLASSDCGEFPSIEDAEQLSPLVVAPTGSKRRRQESITAARKRPRVEEHRSIKDLVYSALTFIPRSIRRLWGRNSAAELKTPRIQSPSNDQPQLTPIEISSSPVPVHRAPSPTDLTTSDPANASHTASQLAEHPSTHSRASASITATRNSPRVTHPTSKVPVKHPVPKADTPLNTSTAPVHKQPNTMKQRSIRDMLVAKRTRSTAPSIRPSRRIVLDSEDEEDDAADSDGPYEIAVPPKEVRQQGLQQVERRPLRFSWLISPGRVAMLLGRIQVEGWLANKSIAMSGLINLRVAATTVQLPSYGRMRLEILNRAGPGNSSMEFGKQCKPNQVYYTVKLFPNSCGRCHSRRGTSLGSPLGFDRGHRTIPLLGG